MSGARGYSAVEYVLLLMAVVMGAMGIQRYLRLAIQGRMNEARLTLSDQSQPGADPARGIIAEWSYDLVSTETTDAVPGAPKTITLPFGTFSQQQLDLTVDTTVTQERVRTCEPACP